MIIAISGLCGSGKSTVGALVAKKLGLGTVGISFKDIAAEKGISLMDVQELAAKDEKYDKGLDADIVERAKGGNCVVTTWLGPWMVKNSDFRVWLDVSKKERARRVAGRDGIGYEEALRHINARDKGNMERYKRYYNIDINDRSIFDLTVRSDSLTQEQAADRIVDAVNKKFKGSD